MESSLEDAEEWMCGARVRRCVSPEQVTAFGFVPQVSFTWESNENVITRFVYAQTMGAIQSVRRDAAYTS